jgi:hypothetical protein
MVGMLSLEVANFSANLMVELSVTFARAAIAFKGNEPASKHTKLTPLAFAS